MVRTLMGFVALAGLVGCAARSAQPSHRADAPPSQGVRFDQKLDSQVPLDLTFRDETGQNVKLRDYFTDKPVVLVLAYYRCPQLCTQVLNGLVQAMLEMDDKPNQDYRIVTVSFDAREKPELAAAKKKTYVEDRYGRPGAQQAWHFLTGDQANIKSLADAVGFHFRYDERFDSFAHPSGIMVLTPKGRLSRYLFGIDYNPRDLQLALYEASNGKIGSPSNYFLLLCFLHYDESLGKYTPAVMKILRTGGVLTVLGIIALVSTLVWNEKRKARLALDNNLPTTAPTMDGDLSEKGSDPLNSGGQTPFRTGLNVNGALAPDWNRLPGPRCGE